MTAAGKWMKRCGVWAAIVALCAVGVASGDPLPGRPEPERVFDWAYYAELVRRMPADIYALNRQLSDEVTSVSGLYGLMTNLVEHSASQAVIPVDLSRLPPEWISGLETQQVDGLTLYTVKAYRDGVASNMCYFNASCVSLGVLSDQYGYMAAPTTYAPDRLVVTYSLLPESELIKYVWRNSPAPLATSAPSGPKGIPTNSVSKVCFSYIGSVTGGVRLVVAYPWDKVNYPQNSFTGALDVIAGNVLDGGWWDLILSTNVSPATNWIACVAADAGIQGCRKRFYRAVDANKDTDHDGSPDARERFVFHTDWTNANSRPLSVSGVVTYPGRQQGMIQIVASVYSNGWTQGLSAGIPKPGPYTNNGVIKNTNVWLLAYRDMDGNRIRDPWEAWGAYAGNPVVASQNVSGVNLALTDVDADQDGLEDWWEILYFKSTNELPSGDYDRDGLSNQQEHDIRSNPAQRDTDLDGMGDGMEWRYNNSTNSILTSNVYTRLPFTEDFDSYGYGSIFGEIGATNLDFGQAVAMTSNTLVVAAPDDSGRTRGAVYVYRKEVGKWEFQQKLTAWAGQTNDYFGKSVAVSEDFIVVGAPWDNSVGTQNRAGAAYVYRRDVSNWCSQVKLRGFGDAFCDNDYFGWSIALSRSMLAVGVRGDGDNANIGSFYTFRWDGVSWTNQYRRYWDEADWRYTQHNQDRFGSGICFHPNTNTLWIGEPGYGMNEWGALDEYSWDGTTWRLRSELYLPTTMRGDSSMFGEIFDCCDSYILLGAPGNPKHIYNPKGTAYVFEKQGLNWTNAIPLLLMPKDRRDGGMFGSSVAICSSNSLLVGEPSNVREKPYLYCFKRSDVTNWVQTQRFWPQTVGNLFGACISVCGDEVVVGAPNDGQRTDRHGAVYVLPKQGLFAGTLGTNDIPINGKFGWTVSPTNAAKVQTNSVCRGVAALRIDPSTATTVVSHVFGTAAQGLVWVDYRARLVRQALGNAPATNAWDPALYYVNTNGRFVVYDGASDEWVTLQHAPVATGAWDRVTVRLNFTNRVWDLWANCEKVAEGKGFAADVPELHRLRFLGATGTSSRVYVDEVRVAATAPAFLVAGSVGDLRPAYAPVQFGPIRILVLRDQNSLDHPVYTLTIKERGYFSFNVPGFDTYWIRAFCDSDSDGEWDSLEATTGAAAQGPFLLTADMTSLCLLLRDPYIDNDNLPDWWEYRYFGSTSNAAPDADCDGDGLSNLDEYRQAGNPCKKDTDGDGMSDGAEFWNGTRLDVKNSGFVALPFTENFDRYTPGFTNLGPWSVRFPQTYVANGVGRNGSKGLLLGESLGASKAWVLAQGAGLTNANIWVDFYAQQVQVGSGGIAMPDISSLAGRQAAMFVVSTNGQVWVYNGAGGGSWTNSGVSVTTNSYHRYTIREDYAARRFDFYVDKQRVLQNLAFSDPLIREFSRFEIRGGVMGISRVDDVTIATNRPPDL